MGFDRGGIGRFPFWMAAVIDRTHTLSVRSAAKRK
jgi:hypothetical protein